MGDVPSGDVTHAEQRELDALRARAYGPDADISADPVAVARLMELEERVRVARLDALPQPTAASSPGDDSVASEATAGAVSVLVLESAPPGSSRTPRWHTGLIAVTAVVAVLMGGAAWSENRAGPQQTAALHAKTAAVASERRAAGYEVGYELYMDGLRDEVLALPGGEVVADTMIHDQLKPYGILYGRTVGAGPTVDHKFCMIIADLPVSSITCIPVENAYANPVSVMLPAWYSDADSDLFTGLGELVTYTLMPGGSVVAEPSDSTDAAVATTAYGEPTASPPPGWQ
ncbi:hypothetical protein SAMN04487846_2692 [Microbacterium sp. cf046]|uniref:hypothetical protein n=1 Tax=Microbacterium sp. cf046 TaxID=1761803 RepID=UPI0008E46F0B|nr:hypothetical protein [Microbacterium sp. cf046]SFS13456.1 hypothetical protein SAMN04487846_2692 [Microbacterium sp. cf046]